MAEVSVGYTVRLRPPPPRPPREFVFENRQLGAGWVAQLA